MRIENITDLEMLTSILTIDDPDLQENVLDPNGCTKAEFVNGIVMAVKEGYMRVYGIVEEDKLNGYLIAVNNVAPPFSRHIGIGYIYLEDNLINDYGQELLNKLLEWKKQIGANQLRLACETEAQARLYARFGFMKTKTIIMTLD